MIGIRNEVMLYLTFGRGDKRRRTADRLTHRAEHTRFHQDGAFFCFREVGRGTHRPDHLTESEENHQGNGMHMNSSTHETNHALPQSCLTSIRRL